jgi:hypothetical protein
MDTAEFDKTWSELFAERKSLVDMRTTLETELVEIRNKISHLDEVLNHLAPLAGIDWYNTDDNLSGLGLTGAIRFVLQHSAERLSAQDIRRLLIDKRYDLSSLSAPMASIYKVLTRLVDDAGEVEREKEEGRVYYKWKSQISDEDIPF